jgi:ketosteroid isomerase-like protein
MPTANRLSLTILCVLISLDLSAQNDSIAVMKSATNFVTAFNNFDWPTFRASFADGATFFAPSGTRQRGQQEIESSFLSGFPEFTDPANTRKLQISPQDINVQVYGKTAIVTFHLRNTRNGINTVGRRTLVMVKEKRSWKIAHLHASSISEK